MAGRLIYRTRLDPAWIDYNGHLRDAYYALIVSFATDALMDDLGMDSAYRERTHGTLYSLEMHIVYLNEIKRDAEVEVRARIVDHDAKKMLVSYDLQPTNRDEPAAVVEFMLLHVRQGQNTGAQPFPADIAARIEALAQETATTGAPRHGSRKMEIKRR